MKWLGNLFIATGILLMGWFGLTQYQQDAKQQHALDEAKLLIDEEQLKGGGQVSLEDTNEGPGVDASEDVNEELNEDSNDDPVTLSSTEEQATTAYEAFDIPENEAFAILDIEALDRSVPVVDGTSPEDLEKGVGHIQQTSLPGGGEQIVLSGHRDTVFRDFGSLEIGDTFLLNMPYGSFRYEIGSTDIVDADDRTVIRDMGEEVLVVTTCYPFHYVNNAPERFVIYAYPVS